MLAESAVNRRGGFWLTAASLNLLLHLLLIVFVLGTVSLECVGGPVPRCSDLMCHSVCTRVEECLGSAAPRPGMTNKTPAACDGLDNDALTGTTHKLACNICELFVIEKEH